MLPASASGGAVASADDVTSFRGAEQERGLKSANAANKREAFRVAVANAANAANAANKREA